MSEKENLHADHRKRMMKRYIENGIDSFEKHELLEMLLFSVFTRCNTNDISHRLLNEFKSIKGVLSSAAQDLASVKGIGENAAAKICFLGDIYRYVALETLGTVVLNNSDSVIEFCREIVDVSATEFFLILFMDKKRTLITKYLVKGHINHVDLDKREIMTKAVSPGCEYAIAVHNHFGEFIKPSAADITATNNLRMFLNTVKVDLLDHLIITGDSHYSMKTSPVCRGIWL